MRQPLRLSLFAVTAVVASLAQAATTSVNMKHPLLGAVAGDPVANAYFIRPNAGFRGVMGKPVSIRIDGEELLKLAKGEYTLLRLKPWSGEIVVKSSTVVSMGGMNTMTKVEESASFSFAAGETYCIVVAETIRSAGNGSAFTPASIGCDQAIDAVAELAPIGDAVGSPLAR